MMKITYDTEVDAKYVSIKKGKVAETKTINDWLFYDVNKNGEVLGIEILDYSKNYVSIAVEGDSLSHVLIGSDDTEERNEQLASQAEERIVAQSAVVAD